MEKLDQTFSRSICEHDGDTDESVGWEDFVVVTGSKQILKLFQHFKINSSFQKAEDQSIISRANHLDLQPQANQLYFLPQQTRYSFYERRGHQQYLEVQ
ncbi:hypothetical protein FGO68_gene7247 [Halteria grandinella]|uniref:Uncharacterized protein n=1 Tax=Halteria grandinella TaxID=5974 RepID=A0A8J8ND58_HALGN|nr:hypothetical protein FGO68_gene7247 [Halteria grandinella]